MVKIGVLLPTRGALFESNAEQAFKLISAMSQLCEDEGIDSVWVGDSLSAKPRLDPLSVLSALGNVTNTLTLGTSVLLPVLRNPVQLLQEANTVNAISCGRLILGMGLGGAFNQSQKTEWRNAGINYKTRRLRFEEILEIIELSKTSDRINFDGKFYHLQDVELNQQGPNPFKIVVAAHARHGINDQFKRAAKFGDGFISISDSPQEFNEGSALFDQFRLESKTKAEDGEKVMYVTVNINDDEDLAVKDATKFLTQYYGADIWGQRWGPFNSPQHVIARIKDYQNNGANHIIVRFAASDQFGQLETFVAEVLPNIK